MNKLWNKRIPTLFGIGLVAISVILTSFFIKNPTFFKSSASLIDEPQNITITNISGTSFTISYLTKDILPGTISFGIDTNLGFTEIEDIDRQKGSISPKIIHVTTLSNLTASTKYYFAINSGQTTFLNNNVPFETATGPIISTPVVSQTPVNGKVILPNGSAPTQTIAYLTIKGAQSLSTPVNENGDFSFILDFLRSEDLSTYSKLENNSNIKITFVNELFSSRVLSLYSQTNPLPTVTLSNNYDFTFDNNIPIASTSGGIGGFQDILPSPSLSTKTATLSPIILIPKKDQSFTNSQPEFRGTSLPNEKVEITIHSSEAINATVIADKNGNWVFSPEATLNPGPHTLTIQTKDAFGIVKSITQSFVVNATENPTPSISSPSVTPITTPTAAQTPTPTPDLTLLKQIPPTGNSDILIIGLTAIAITIIGLILFTLTRSKTSL